jgi:hypothetical protein
VVRDGSTSQKPAEVAGTYKSVSAANGDGLHRQGGSAAGCGRTTFTDGIIRTVSQDSDARQFILDDAGQAVFSVWVSPWLDGKELEDHHHA